MANLSVVLQRGHGKFPVISAALLKDNTILASLDSQGTIVFWDIRSARQLSEAESNQFKNAPMLQVLTPPGQPTQLEVRGGKLFAYGRNALFSFDEGLRQKTLEFSGNSKKCMENPPESAGRSRNPNSPYVIYAPCRDVIPIGTLPQQDGHYAHISELNEFVLNGLNSSADSGPFTINVRDFGLPFTSFSLSNTRQMAYSLENSQLVLADDSHLLAYRLNTSGMDPELISIFSREGLAPGTFRLSPQADAFFHLAGQQLFKTQLPSGETEVLLEIENPPGSSPSLFIGAKLAAIDTGSIENSHFQVFELDSQALIFERRLEHPHTILHLSPQHMVSRQGKNGPLHLWNLERGTLERVFQAHIPKITALEPAENERELFFILGHKAAYSMQLDGNLEIREKFKWDAEHHLGTTSPNGQSFASINKARDTLTFKNGRQPKIDIGPLSGLSHLKFSPDSRHLGVIHSESTIVVFLIEEGLLRPLFPDKLMEGKVYALAFHPREELLAVVHGNRIALLDTNGGQIVGEPVNFTPEIKEGEYGLSLSFSKTGRFLLLQSERMAAVFELMSGLALEPLFHQKEQDGSLGFGRSKLKRSYASSIAGMSFLNEDQWLAVQLSGQKTLEIWNIDVLVEQVKTHDGIRGRFTAQPEKVLRYEGTPFKSTLFYDTPALAIFYECKEEGFALANWKAEPEPEKNAIRIIAYPVDEKNALLLDPETNYYYSSAEGHQLMAFEREGLVFPIGQFGLLFNRPGRVLAKAGLSDEGVITQFERAFEKRIESVFGHLKDTNPAIFEKLVRRLKTLSDNPREINNLKLPEIEVELAGGLESTLGSTQQREIELKLAFPDVEGLDSPLEKLHLHINDVPLFGSAGRAFSSITDVNASISVALSRGLNKIEASVVNQMGAESIRETLYISYDGPVHTPSLYLIGIGMEKHEADPSLINLEFPKKDITNLIEALATRMKAGQSNFKTLNTATLFDDTQSEVKAFLSAVKEQGHLFSVSTAGGTTEVESSLMQTHVDDEVIVLYAGHGIRTAAGQLVLSARDTNGTANTVDYRSLEGLLDGIPARKKLLIIDACNSGEQESGRVDQETAALFGLMKASFADLRRGGGATILAGAQAWQDALEGGSFENSALMNALLVSVKNGKQKISQLLGHIIDEVPTLLLKQYLEKELPKLIAIPISEEEQEHLLHDLSRAITDELSRGLPRRDLEEQLTQLILSNEVFAAGTVPDASIIKEIVVPDLLNGNFQQPTLRTINFSMDWEL